MRLRDMMTSEQREDIIRSLTIIEEKLAEPGALYDIEGKREAIRLQKNLRFYFQRLAYDVDKIDWKENFERFALVSNIPELVAKYRDPITGRLTPDNYHAALTDAMRRVEPFVEKHNVELFTILQDGLEKSYSGGAVNYWKAMPEGANIPGAGGSLKRTDQSLKSRALEWSKQHAAKLVTNVDEATKEKISKIMAETIDEGKGLHEARRRLQKELEINMPRERAQMIARTESSGAWNRGTWDQLKERGIRYKGIVTHDPCEICQAMKAAGPIPIDVPFPRIKGKPSKMTHDQYPPFHPRCYCSLVGKEAPSGSKVDGYSLGERPKQGPGIITSNPVKSADPKIDPPENKEIGNKGEVKTKFSEVLSGKEEWLKNKIDLECAIAINPEGALVSGPTLATGWAFFISGGQHAATNIVRIGRGGHSGVWFPGGGQLRHRKRGDHPDGH